MDNKQKSLLEEKAAILKALGNPARLYIVERLKIKKTCVCDLVKDIDLDFSTVSRHLNTLKKAGIITSEKKGKQVFYRLEVPCILDFISCVERVIINNIEKQKNLIN
ncbi:MAG: transcriptional regulator [Candidatus Muiribacterium halophilum]|uniref:Transcriptional regulator n=1 Tax=Muiribacterium halophilum TaxID=2053465 RepID=A0A2N5ZMD2_MUIH1|nr:MAG: transcriptional regulator [Candidatus Muirbacterium halophilum]